MPQKSLVFPSISCSLRTRKLDIWLGKHWKIPLDKPSQDVAWASLVSPPPQSNRYMECKYLGYDIRFLWNRALPVPLPPNPGPKESVVPASGTNVSNLTGTLCKTATDKVTTVALHVLNNVIRSWIATFSLLIRCTRHTKRIIITAGTRLRHAREEERKTRKPRKVRKSRNSKNSRKAREKRNTREMRKTRKSRITRKTKKENRRKGRMK